jgi:putative addiction module component (TIGR02574 family)
LADLLEDFARDHGIATYRVEYFACPRARRRYIGDMSAAEILEQIRRLPPAEQHELAEKILIEFWEVDDELTPEQVAELERRAEDAIKNPGRGTPWEQLRDETLRQYRG